LAEISTKIRLDLEGIPREDRKRVKEDVGEFVVNEISRHLAEGKSPVKGQSFKKLSKDYADGEKLGDRTPNLQAEGDLLDSLVDKSGRGNLVKVGHFLAREVPKADGHNQHTNKAKNWAKRTKFPKRQYLPEEGQLFKRDIEKGIDEIVTDAKDAAEEQRQLELESETIESEEPQQSTEVQATDLFNDDVISSLLNDEFNKGAGFGS